MLPICKSFVPRRRSQMIQCAVLTVMLGGLGFGTGCATQETVDEGRTAIRAQDQRLAELEQEAQSWKSQTQRANELNTRYLKQINERDAAIASLKAGLERAKTDNEELLNRMDELNIMVLPSDVDEALQDLAAQHPDILMYDSDRGMIRLASDLTFASGSDVVQPEAAQALKEIAAVLKNPELSSLEIRIVGHTDTVPIGKPETRAKHPTNIHLSVHRAISVENVLKDAGIDPRRMIVAGWGPYRPIVPNDPKKGAAANRRVELFLIQSDSSYEMMESAPDEQASGMPVGPAGGSDNEPMK